MNRAYFTADLNWRWWRAQLPDRLRENIFPWPVESRDSVCESFQSTNGTFARQNRHFLIRSTLKSAVVAEEPAAAVRDSMLAAAAHENVLRPAIGPAIPLLAEDLQEHQEPAFDSEEQVMTSIPLARRQLLLIAAPLYAVR